MKSLLSFGGEIQKFLGEEFRLELKFWGEKINTKLVHEVVKNLATREHRLANDFCKSEQMLEKRSTGAYNSLSPFKMKRETST